MTASTKPDLNQVVASRRRAIDPALGETCLTSLSDLNRLVRTRMLGGVGRAVSNGRPYPIGHTLYHDSGYSAWVGSPPLGQAHGARDAQKM